MDKSIVVNYIGGGNQRITASRLGYTDHAQVYHWPQALKPRQVEAIFLRMRANKIKIPAEWLAESARI